MNREQRIHSCSPMRLERVHQGLANDLDTLNYIIKEHMLESAPSLTCLLRPPAKKKKALMFQLIKFVIVVLNLQTCTQKVVLD